MARNSKRGRRHKHLLVAADLQQRIAGREWTIGQRLPSIEAFMKAYGHSRVTIHKAIQELSAQGYLRVEQGNGTFVQRHQKPRVVGLVVSDGTRNPQATPFAYLVVEAVRRLVEARGWTFQLYFQRNTSNLNAPPEVPGLDRDLAAGRLDGLITASCNLPKHLPFWPLWQAHAVPIVTVGEEGHVDHCVVFGPDAIVNEFFRLCQRCNKKRLSLVGLNSEYYGSESLAAVAKAAGAELCKPWVANGVEVLGPEHFGFEALMGIWSAGSRPDALLVMDDVIAKGVASAILALGLKEEERPLIVVHTNRGSNIFYPIDVHAIESDPAEFASAGLEILSQLMNDPALPAKKLDILPSPARAMNSPSSSRFKVKSMS